MKCFSIFTLGCLCLWGSSVWPSTEITLGILSNLTAPWKGYQKSKAGRNFRSVYTSGLAAFQEGLRAHLLEEEKRKSKMGRKETNVLCNTHTLILQCCLQYICLLISSKFAKQEKHTLRKSCPHNNLDPIPSFNSHRQGNLQIQILQSKRHAKSFAIWRHLQSTGWQQDRQFFKEKNYLITNLLISLGLIRP